VRVAPTAADPDRSSPITGPRSRSGGTNYIDNILPACGSCNRRKHTYTEEEFRARLAAEIERAKENGSRSRNAKMDEQDPTAG
jgi:hypothetical protein